MSRLVVLAAIAVLAAGCGGRPQAAASDDITVEVSTVPRAVAALRPVTLVVRCRDRAGRPVAVRISEARLAMPEMSHGAERIVLHPAGAGRYEASHTFSMDGVWQLQIRGVVGGRAFAAQIPIHVGIE
ncbi:MAG: FixH family protein [Armatimonadota bacterium]|nr:FixH family protein [Armatimonadota bacterium]MDR7450549.1 FixH family protein [Armatimonadota bacterium]MDR7466318.1 FixH family protein [Armatimonadota bacterium]MDR7493039.1 FixH family protein [Armatimonadota bacterium]MDR7498204.1 FixH family protein [Armatimonadota bacterium]